jgi:hypothetical protein
MRRRRISAATVSSTQRDICCRTFAPALPENPAASVRDCCSGAYIVGSRKDSPLTVRLKRARNRTMAVASRSLRKSSWVLLGDLGVVDFMAQPDGAPRLSRSFSDPSSASRIGDSSRRQVALIWMRVRRVCGADRRGLYPSCDAHSCPLSTLVAQRRRDGVDCHKRTNGLWAPERQREPPGGPEFESGIRVRDGRCASTRRTER